jgi:hypothetical protein
MSVIPQCDVMLCGGDGGGFDKTEGMCDALRVLNLRLEIGVPKVERQVFC